MATKLMSICHSLSLVILMITALHSFSSVHGQPSRRCKLIDHTAFDRVDWRRCLTSVNRVKNQGKCYTCWAFAAVAALEARNEWETGEDITLSEQQLLDCDEFNKGCIGGGTLTKAYQYIINNGGVTTAQLYPYIEGDGECKRYPSFVTISQFRRNHTRYPLDEKQLETLVAQRPVAATMHASLAFQKLRTGRVFKDDECIGKPNNHCVLIIGYGVTEDGYGYWLIKNSWGRDWGEGGYGRIRKGGCGLGRDIVYPVLNI